VKGQGTQSKESRWAGSFFPRSVQQTGWGHPDGHNVTGNPHTIPIAQYTSSAQQSAIHHPDIVMGNAGVQRDVVVTGMLHARMVGTATLGSTLLSSGSVDKGPGSPMLSLYKEKFVAVGRE